MVSIFDAVVLDWWIFTKTDIFGLLIKVKTGRTPDVKRVDPQWDGKEFLKLFLEAIISVVLAWIFIQLKTISEIEYLILRKLPFTFRK